MSAFKGVSLLEADPSSNYERVVRDFAVEMVAAGRALFVLTSRRSPVHLILRDMEKVRFFVLSDANYPKNSGTPGEVLVPRSDYSVLLNVIDEAVSKPPGTPKAMVLDNVSAVILDSGFQDAYKFLRQVNEIVSHGDVISLSIVLSKAHDERTMNLVRNLFSSHLSFDSSGLHVMK